MNNRTLLENPGSSNAGVDNPDARTRTEMPEPAIAFFQLLNGLENGVEVGASILDQNGATKMDRSLLRRILNVVDAPNPPQSLAELPLRVAGLEESMTARIEAALLEKNALRSDRRELRPEFVAAILRGEASLESCCPPPLPEIEPFDLEGAFEPGILDLPGAFLNPGMGQTGLDLLLGVAASVAISTLIQARISHDPGLTPLIDQLEEVTYRRLCRNPIIADPRQRAKQVVDQAFEKLSSPKLVRNAQQQMLEAAYIALGEIYQASTGSLIRLPDAWKNRFVSFEFGQDEEDDSGFGGELVRFVRDLSYDLQLQLNTVKCKVETSPKVTKDEYRMALDVEVNGETVAVDGYADDFKEGQSTSPNKQIVLTPVFEDKGKITSFRATFIPYESDAFTKEDANFVARIIELVSNFIFVPGSQMIKDGISNAPFNPNANVPTIPADKANQIRELLLKLMDKEAVNAALNQIVRGNVLDWLANINGPDAFTPVVVTGATVGNGENKRPRRRLSVQGGILSEKMRIQTSPASIGIFDIVQLLVYELEPKLNGKPGEDPNVGAYQLDMRMVVREMVNRVV